MLSKSKILTKIIKKCGSTLNIGSHVYYAYPSPGQLNNASYDELRECGLSFRKVEYIKDISKLIIDGKLDLEKFKEYNDKDQIIDELQKIRGVGIWTAELTVLRGLNKLETILADDIGLQRGISHYYGDGEKISSENVRKIAENWGKWKGLAAFYLIIAEILDIKIG
jgi:DNA-3-methyladenine glycosylase II